MTRGARGVDFSLSDFILDSINLNMFVVTLCAQSASSLRGVYSFRKLHVKHPRVLRSKKIALNAPPWTLGYAKNYKKKIPLQSCLSTPLSLSFSFSLYLSGKQYFFIYAHNE